MPKVNLTDTFCRTAKPIDGRLTEYADAKERGLALRVTADGIRSWTFRYRNFAKQQKRLSLGRLDDVSLADARSRVVIERAKVEKRQDPVALRRAEQHEAVEASKLETVSEIGDRYFKDAVTGRHRPNGKPKRASTLASERSYFDKHIVPKFGKDRLADLSRARVQGFLNDVGDAINPKTKKSSPSAARQCKVVLHALFNFAIWQGIADSNPCQFASVRGFAARERVLTNDELKTLWQTFRTLAAAREETKARPIDELYVSPSVAMSVLLCAMTLQRRSEVTGMRKSEIDAEARLWTIPGERTKNHRTHIVPLSPVASDLVALAVDLSGDSDFVFPSPRDQEKPIEGAALSHAFRRVCKSLKLKGIRPHDLRRTGATALTGEALGFPRFIVSRVLNHASDNAGAAAVTGVYDRNTYLPEKRRALEAWARHLQRIVGEVNEGASAEIVTLHVA